MKLSAGWIVGIGLLVAMVICLGVGIASAIAVPRFTRASRPVEARSMLRGAYSAERTWLADTGSYTESVESAQLLPGRNNRYRYFLGDGSNSLIADARDGGDHNGVFADESRPGVNNAVIRSAVPPALLAEAGVRGECPERCRVTIVAAGNIDDDPVIDVWSISSADRVIDGVNVDAGVLYRHLNDEAL